MKVLAFLPLLGGVQQPDGLSPLLESYRDRSATRTATALLRDMDHLSPHEQRIAAFLLGNDFAELGLTDLAVGELEAVLETPELGGAAFLALARVRNDEHQSEELHSDARRAPWQSLKGDELDEALFRVARACMEAGRYPEAREWLGQLTRNSRYFSASRVLLIQTEYALGRTARALDAAEIVFRDPARAQSARWLQDRTAVLVGDILTEVGLYPYAIGVLDWSSAGSPFHARAERDRALARALQEASSGGTVVDATADEERERLQAEIAASTGSERAIAARSADLERVWPSPVLRRARRQWAQRSALEAYDHVRGFDWRRPLQILWRSLPPVALYELVRHRPTEPPVPDAFVEEETRFYFAPRREIGRLLVAIALTSEAVDGKSCAERSAVALAARIAGSIAGTAPAVVSAEELGEIARGCSEADAAVVRPVLERRLGEALAAEAARRTVEIRNQRYLLSEAAAAAQFEHVSALGEARGANQ